jgi:3-oxoacyl-[acyl-carrier-protein] synthase II
LGTLGAFVVIEARAHAELRDARPLARLVEIAAGRSRRRLGEAAATARRLWERMPRLEPETTLGVISCAPGSEPATSEEQQFLASLSAEGYRLAVRGIGGVIGHAMETQFAAGIALAALALSRGEFYAPFEQSGFEAPVEEPPRRILVTSFGQWRGEALALLERAEGAQDGAA